MIDRRTFLCTGLGAGLASLLSGSARPRSSPRKLIIALAYGGWDAMWALDPKPDHSEVNKIPGKIRNFGSLPIWVDPSRSAVTEFFEQWSSMATVINGIAVESLAHESCIDIMLTGALGEKRPDLAARLAKAHGQSLPLPYFALSAQAEKHGFEAHTGMLGDSNQLLSLATPQLNFPEPGKMTPDLGLNLNPQEQAAIQKYLQQAAQSMRSKDAIAPNKLRQLEDYQQALRHADQLKSRARQGGMLADATLISDQSGGWKHVPAAFGDGLSLTALIQPDIYWDTHSYNQQQGKAYQEFFSGLNLMMAELHRHKVLESTDVLVLSEMGRTPMHNPDGGKDHWPWTSAILLSSQLRGERVVGQSDELLRPIPMDMKTGKADPKGSLMHAEQLLATIAQLHQAPAKTWFEKEAIGALLA